MKTVNEGLSIIRVELLKIEIKMKVKIANKKKTVKMRPLVQLTSFNSLFGELNLQLLDPAEP